MLLSLVVYSLVFKTCTSITLLFYVDDIFITGNDAEKCKDIKKYLDNKFQNKGSWSFKMFPWDRGG